MRIWHRLLGIFLLSEALWYAYKMGISFVFGDLETAFLVLTAAAIGVILTAKG